MLKFTVKEYVESSGTDDGRLNASYHVIDGPFRGRRFWIKNCSEILKGREKVEDSLCEEIKSKYSITIAGFDWDVTYTPSPRKLRATGKNLTGKNLDEGTADTSNGADEGVAA